jgi:pentatricopeptide repeat protein
VILFDREGQQGEDMIQKDLTHRAITRRVKRVPELALKPQTTATISDASSGSLLRLGNMLLAALGDQGVSQYNISLHYFQALSTNYPLYMSGHLSHAEIVLDLMNSHSITASLVTYTTLISRAGAWKQVDLAERYFDQMISAGLRPDAQAFNR